MVVSCQHPVGLIAATPNCVKNNRLFGVTAQIMWVPKPPYQLTPRTPLYFVRN